MKDFLHFLRTQGVIALAIAFIIGAAAQDFVKSLSSDLITPTIGLIAGRFGDLQNASSTISGVTYGWGHIIYALVNLILVALVIYLIVKTTHIDKIDEKKEG
ncbi:MscL family protein [Candidatus Parcubacteria bacterium]|nr:MscL family protein [Candidatus Parcubacteria bacterium]